MLTFYINQYVPNVQRFLKFIPCKTKPEPWLHIAIVAETKRNAKNDKLVQDIVYAIYVWDTRQVIESGKVEDIPLSSSAQLWRLQQAPRGMRKSQKDIMYIPIAKDNREPLIGNNKEIQLINERMEFYFNKKHK